MRVALDSFLKEVCEKTTENNQFPVLTSSKAGLFLQSDYFNKQVASTDNTGYKIIRRGQFTYRAMSDTGEFFPNMLECTDIGIVSPAYPVFEITKKNDVLPEYLKYYFKSDSFQYSIASFAQGSTRTSVKFSKLKTVSIDLPCADKQREIVDILNRSKALISAREKELQALDDLIKARFVEMFAKYENTSHLVLDDISEMVTVGIANSATHAYSKEGVIMFRNQNIKEGFLDDSDLIYIREDFANKYKTKALKRNDLLVTRTGYPGIACIVPEKYEGCQTFTTLIVRLKNDANIRPVFVCHYINSSYGTEFVTGNQVGVAQQNFGAKSLAQMPIFLPPVEEQIDFENLIELVDKSKFVVQQALDKAQLLFDSLMQEYFG